MNNDNKEINEEELDAEEIKYLNMQILAVIGFIVALCISLFLTYNKKLSLEKKKTLFSEESAQNLALMQSVLVFLIAIMFLYVNYKRYTIAKKKHSDEEQDQLLQIETSIFSIISAIIGLYIIYKNYRKRILSITETEVL